MATIDALRDLIYARDRGVCGICSLPVERTVMSLDHIQPRAHGGPDTVDNLRTAHRLCNMRRGPGRTVDSSEPGVKVKIRLSDDLRTHIERQAASRGRSLNAQMVYLLERDVGQAEDSGELPLKEADG